MPKGFKETREKAKRNSIAVAAVTIFAFVFAKPVLAGEYFSDEQEQIIAEGFQDFQHEFHNDGMLGVQATVKDCYQSAASHGLREKAFYCLAFDTQAAIYYRVARSQGFRPGFIYFENDTYDTRIRKNLAEVGMPNQYEQTDFIAAMKDELNRVAGQYVRRETGKDTSDEQHYYINRTDGSGR